MSNFPKQFIPDSEKTIEWCGQNLDAIVTGELCLEAMTFSINFLNGNGGFISKIFMGSSFNEIVAYAKKAFKDVRIFKPLASRKDSKENFLICKKLR